MSQWLNPAEVGEGKKTESWTQMLVAHRGRKKKKKEGHEEITWKLEIKINFAHCLFNTCREKKYRASPALFSSSYFKLKIKCPQTIGPPLFQLLLIMIIHFVLSPDQP